MILFKGVRNIETQTIITVFLALALLYRLMELLVKTIIIFVAIIALFVIGWGVYRKVGRKKK